MPHFSAAGYDCYALSQRCQGGSDRPPGARWGGCGALKGGAGDEDGIMAVAGRGPLPPACRGARRPTGPDPCPTAACAPRTRAGTKVAGTLGSLAADLGSFVASLPAPPVVVAHSFAGLVLQKCAVHVPHLCSCAAGHTPAPHALQALPLPLQLGHMPGLDIHPPVTPPHTRTHTSAHARTCA